ncbi:hypothetical protein NEMIN01_1352 [Nematocida minor]|uniref:uncharacterized protein n=1 Tax=Nematocida minor TaxID=1912983 RepID=UPI00221F1E23|nr:uncharacterized protein NEMIN01_1352 [Nematocida minor]KAI5191083.1 hypothetical protein NEMIN01_1352 [Nematocida minor]
MFSMNEGRVPWDLLEKYAGAELDPEDHSGFLAICRLFGVTEKRVCKKDSELAEVLQELKRVCGQFGVNILHDFCSLQKECRVREEIEKQENENDRMEVELSKSKDEVISLHIKKIRLNELVKERKSLEEEVSRIEKVKEYSEISREVLQLAKTLNIKTAKDGEESAVLSKPDCSIDFHNYFMPFVNLSIETVNFIYAQLQARGTPESKERKVLLMMKYHQKRIEANLAYSRYKTPTNTLDYLITLILIEKSAVNIKDVCQLLKKERQEVIRRIFFLCSKRVLLFNRTEDTITLHSASTPPHIL